MCGIAGLVSMGREQPEHVVVQMLDAIRHRGPDDAGFWTDARCGVFLGHRRLSVIDVSSAGHQPMESGSGRYVIVLNGEIYNFEALRSSLAGCDGAPTWRGHSDTEVLLACIDAWGLEAAVSRAQGMFAFAVWDQRDQTLTLARDRMGEKPLYFGWIGGDFVFASEMKALATHPAWAPQVQLDCLTQFLRLGYYGGARSLVSGLYRLPPGALLTFPLADLATPKGWDALSPKVTRYWSLGEIAVEGQRNRWLGRPGEAADELERLLRGAVRRQIVADVPLGAFLSGGIDSSLIVALMQQETSSPVKTFSIGFDDAAHDEAVHARAVAGHLGTDHHELYVDERQALDLMPSLPALFDEPLADPSQLPTVLVARLARRHVTVALSGDGGDELFAGYARYPAILRYWRVMGLLPRFARRGVLAAVNQVAESDTLLGKWSGSVGPRLRRLAARHQGGNLEALRQTHIGGVGQDLLLRRPDFGQAEWADERVKLSALQQVLLADQMDYLPNDILMKVDRAAMSVGLETRVPMLDPAVIAFSWRLRTDDLISHGESKRVLREVAYRHVPRSLLERPKQGFAPPIGLWLRGALRPLAEDLLANLPANMGEVVSRERLSALWKHHLSGRLDAGYVLWRVLMYVAWARQYGAAA